MKISNETKVGAIVVVAITLLILGFSFLKGKKLFSKSTTLYAVYENIQGLQNSNPIFINGMQVGTVYKITPSKDMREILVDFNITKDIQIPNNSIAIVKPNPLGTTNIEIKLGDANSFLKNKDTLITEANKGIFDDVLKKVDPVLYEVRKAISTLDTTIHNINSIIDPRAKNNIGDILQNVNTITASFIKTTAQLNALLSESSPLVKSMNNMNSITGNLASNNDKVSHIVTNLDKTTTNLSEIDLQKTMNNLNAAVGDLQKTMAKLSTNDGTLGKLINDPTLYQNLASTGNKLNLLIDDIRIHPKRYVSISVFGKKQKNEPIMVPVPDTLNSPYYIEKVNP
ncbi:MAG: MCE family protein [Niastella sp.]|nr:MCE family protein [Niastella sp.]